MFAVRTTPCATLLVTVTGDSSHAWAIRRQIWTPTLPIAYHRVVSRYTGGAAHTRQVPPIAAGESLAATGRIHHA